LRVNINRQITGLGIYFTDRGGVDIAIVRRRFRQVEGFSVSREDVADALIEMKKDGLLRYNMGALNMEFVDE